MHEALIRMIPSEDFWEPHTTKQRFIKWGIIVFLLLLSIFIFLINLDGLMAYENACNNPVYVQATITVRRSTGLTASVGSLDAVLSYNYDGVQYQDVYYRGNQNPRMWDDHGDTITVAVNPKNPSQLVKWMLNEMTVLFSILLWALGLSMLVYTIALDIPVFYTWRIRAANKPPFLSRPYGKPSPVVFKPDYIKDIAVLIILICIVTIVILSLIFPHTFSMIN